jgi:hypothetical protein
MPDIFAKTQEAFGAGIRARDEKIAAERDKPKPREFAFTSFNDAIRNIQTSLGKESKDKEQQKQTGVLQSIDNGIKNLVKRPQSVMIGV